MTKAVMTVDFLAPREGHRPAMNPASIVWPEWPRDEPAKVFAMSTRPRAWKEDQPVTILNKGLETRMTLKPDAKITLADGHTGEVEWTGTWAEFAEANGDDEDLDEVRAKLEKGGPAYVGGGAAAYFKVTVAPTHYEGVVFNNQGRPVKVTVPLKE